MNHYDILYIIPGAKTEDEAQQSVQAVRQMLRDHGATVVKEDFWGKRRLAFAIGDQRHGYYDAVDFDLDPSKLQPLDQILRLSDQVLRYQIVERMVLTPEQRAAVMARRERIAARRQAEKDKETVAGLAAEAQAPAATTGKQPRVSEAELEEKLEEILDEKTIDV